MATWTAAELRRSQRELADLKLNGLEGEYEERLDDLTSMHQDKEDIELFASMPPDDFRPTRRLVRIEHGTTTWYAKAEELRQVLADHHWVRTSDGYAGDHTMLEWWKAPLDPETGEPHQDAYSLLCAAIEPDPAEDAPELHSFLDAHFVWSPDQQSWYLGYPQQWFDVCKPGSSSCAYS